MVGNLNDKVRNLRPAPVGVQAAHSTASQKQGTIRLALTPAQLDSFLDQWNAAEPNAPLEVVLSVGTEVVGELHVLSASVGRPAQDPSPS